MKNRDNDVSQRNSPTEAGKQNRQVAEEKGRHQNSGTSAEFGQSGRPENFEGGEMRNRNEKNPSNTGRKDNSEVNDSGRTSGSKSYGSSSGRSGSSGNSASKRGGSDRELEESEISNDSGRRGSGSMDD